VPRIGLVLGGGGVAGFAYHTGALAALQQQTGWDPRLARIIVGTSAGSGVGALLRGGVPVGAVLERQLSLPSDPRGMARLREMTGRDGPAAKARPRWWIVPSSPKLALRQLARGPALDIARIGSALLPEGRIPTRAIGERARELFGDGWPNLPLWLVAVRLDDGARVVFGRDDTSVNVGRAVEASSAIPAFFQPVEIGGTRYVDGGIHSATNADLLADQELDLVVVVSPLSASPKLSASTILGPVRTYCHLGLRRELSHLHRAGIKTLVLEPSLDEVRAMGPNMMDPSRTVFVVLQSTQSVARRLARPEMAEALEILGAAAMAEAPPLDVAYPE
jgi:NTE family protein